MDGNFFCVFLHCPGLSLFHALYLLSSFKFIYFLLVYLVLTVQPTDCEYQRVVWVTYLWILWYRSCFSCLDFLTPPCCLQFSHILGWVSGGNLLLSISKIHTPGVLCLMQIFLFNSGLCFAACCVSCLIIVDWVFCFHGFFQSAFFGLSFLCPFSETRWLYGWTFWPCFECAPGTSVPSPPLPWATAYVHHFLIWVKDHATFIYDSSAKLILTQIFLPLLFNRVWLYTEQGLNHLQLWKCFRW